MDVRDVSTGGKKTGAPRAVLFDIVSQVAEPDGLAWLENALAMIRDTGDKEVELLQLYPMARRKLGRDPLEDHAPVVQTADGEIDLVDWSLGDIARAIFIIDALDQGGDISLVSALFRAGDEGERIAITRALSLFGNGSAVKPLALESGRTNSVALFTALSMGNPYPAANYTEHEFNQLVLKSLFISLPIERIVGLTQRANAELSRMCEDYFDERTSAGRAVPPDIWLAMMPFASKRGRRLAGDHLQHDDARHRHYAGIAMRAEKKQ